MENYFLISYLEECAHTFFIFARMEQIKKKTNKYKIK